MAVARTVGNDRNRQVPDITCTGIADPFRAAFDAAPIATALISLGGAYLSVNRAFTAMTGYSNQRALQLTSPDLNRSDDGAPDFLRAAALVDGSAQTISSEQELMTAGGTLIWTTTSTSLVRGDDGLPQYLVSQIQDITDRKRNEQALAEERRRLIESQFIGGLGSWEIDLETDEITRSASLFQLFGLDRDHCGGYLETRDKVVHPDDRKVLAAAMHECAKTGQPLHLRYRITRANDGAQRWIDARGARFLEPGRPARLAGTVTDATEAVLGEAVRASQDEALQVGRRQEALLTTLVQGVVVIDQNNIVTTANPAAARIFGVSVNDLIGSVGLYPRWGAINEGGSQLATAEFPAARAIRDRATRNGTIGIVTSSGEVNWQDITAVPMLDVEARLECVIVGLSDASEARRSRQALADSEQRFRLAFEAAPVGMAMIDLSDQATGRLILVNASLCAFTGRTSEQLQLLDLDAISHSEEADSNRAIVERLRTGHQATSPVEKRFRRADGSTVYGQLGVSFMPSAGGRPAYGICLIEDITARRTAAAAVLHRSRHDQLTGLANRHLLYDRIRHALTAAGRSGKPVGLLYLDLDGFKQVNDRSGHAAGDELLIQAAARLRRTARPGDTVARLGGDEFAVVCVDIADDDNLRKIANRVLATLNIPFRLSATTHQISASIGIQLVAGPTDPDQLLAAADAAMYRAKAAGRNRIGTSGDDLRDDHTRGASRLEHANWSTVTTS